MYLVQSKVLTNSVQILRTSIQFATSYLACAYVPVVLERDAFSCMPETHQRSPGERPSLGHIGSTSLSLCSCLSVLTVAKCDNVRWLVGSTTSKCVVYVVYVTIYRAFLFVFIRINSCCCCSDVQWLVGSTTTVVVVVVVQPVCIEWAGTMLMLFGFFCEPCVQAAGCTVSSELAPHTPSIHCVTQPQWLLAAIARC